MKALFYNNLHHIAPYKIANPHIDIFSDTPTEAIHNSLDNNLYNSDLWLMPGHIHNYSDLFNWDDLKININSNKTANKEQRRH